MLTHCSMVNAAGMLSIHCRLLFPCRLFNPSSCPGCTSAPDNYLQYLQPLRYRSNNIPADVREILAQQTSIKFCHICYVQGLSGVSVETADMKSFQHLIYTLVKCTNPMHNAWEKVCDVILSDLDLCKIESYQSGHSDHTVENPSGKEFLRS